VNKMSKLCFVGDVFPHLTAVRAFENQFDKVVLRVLGLPFRVPMLHVGISEETITSLANKIWIRSHSCLRAIQRDSTFNLVFLRGCVRMYPVKLIIATSTGIIDCYEYAIVLGYRCKFYQLRQCI